MMADKDLFFIMTDLGTVLPHYRNIIIQVSCAVIGGTDLNKYLFYMVYVS